MPPGVEFVSVMEHALAIMDKIALFYVKYHLLPLEERWVLQHELTHRHHEWAKCSALEQQHVEFVRVLMRELNLHYDEWMQDEYVARKRWYRHPGEELNRLRTEVQSTTAQMDSDRAPEQETFGRGGRKGGVGLKPFI
jgi:hypothetical protein